jgi:hypothetical protein
MSRASHATYKRDQIERAIAIASRIIPQHEPTRFTALKVELKRLLDRDRRQEQETPRGRPVRRAFHSEAPPGRGIDVMYSGYEAFALLIALRLMRGGLPQARAVDVLHDLRAPLAGCHYEMLQIPLPQLRPDRDDDKRDLLVRDGLLVDDASKMVYLVALAGERAEAFDLPSPADKPVSGNICRSVRELHERVVGASHEGHALIVVELVNAAHQLAYHLDRIEPRARGRR